MADDTQALHTTQTKPKRSKKCGCGGYTCCKILVYFYSFFFLTVGLLLLILGSWAATVRNDYRSVNNYLDIPAAIAIAIGLGALLLGILGFVGAKKDHLTMLRAFLVLVILVFIFQVIIGILAYVYREQAAGAVNSRLVHAMEQYSDRGDIKTAVDHIQRNFDCCGLQSYKDWNHNEMYECGADTPENCGVPESCCKALGIEEAEQANSTCGYDIRHKYPKSNPTLEARIWTNGCTSRFILWVETHLDIVGAVGLGFAIPQVIGMMIVWCFIVKVEDNQVIYKYKRRIYEA